jgi:speckle-type POZ protein
MPLSNLHRDLSNLLWKKQGVGVVIDVGGEATFKGHGWLLGRGRGSSRRKLHTAARRRSPAAPSAAAWR